MSLTSYIVAYAEAFRTDDYDKGEEGWDVCAVYAAGTPMAFVKSDLLAKVNAFHASIWPKRPPFTLAHMGHEDTQILWQAETVQLTPTPPQIDILSAEFQAYTKAQGLEQECDASELLFLDLTPVQRAWVSDFVQRWEAAANADPEFYDKQAVVGRDAADAD